LKNELSDCYFNLGEVYLFEKEYTKALDYYFKGLKIDQEQNNKENLASGYNMIGELYMEIDDLVKAEEYFKDSDKLAQETNSRMDLANVNNNLGCYIRNRGERICPGSIGVRRRRYIDWLTLKNTKRSARNYRSWIIPSCPPYANLLSWIVISLIITSILIVLWKKVNKKAIFNSGQILSVRYNLIKVKYRHID